MKKIIIVFLGISIMLVSCMSKAEKQAKKQAAVNEILATSCVKATLKCPSTMQVSHIEQMEIDENISYDTLYHINKIVRRTQWEYGIKFEYEIKQIEIDSLKELKRKYPAHTRCNVFFDAQNSYGAMVRGDESVVIINGEAILFQDFFTAHYEAPETRIWSVDPIVYTDKFKYNLEYLVNTGDWVSLNDLFDNKD